MEGQSTRKVKRLSKYADYDLGVSLTTAWRLRKNDPDFPPVFYVSKTPMILESDGDAYLTLLIERAGKAA